MKNILVTGGSGGIGSQVVEYLIDQGYRLHLTFKNNVQAVQNLKKKFPTQIEVFKLDMGANLFEQEDFKSLLRKDILFSGAVFCHGVHEAGPLLALSDEQIFQQIQVNLTSTIILTREILKAMVQKREGSIIFIGSVAAHRVTRGHSVYSASKAALEGFTKALASEVAKREIRVNCILPGPIKTKMLEKTIDETGDTPEKRVPMQKLIQPIEIAQLVHFLIGDCSKSITGSMIPLDGGYLLW